LRFRWGFGGGLWRGFDELAIAEELSEFQFPESCCVAERDEAIGDVCDFGIDVGDANEFADFESGGDSGAFVTQPGIPDIVTADSAGQQCHGRVVVLDIKSDCGRGGLWGVPGVGGFDGQVIATWCEGTGGFPANKSGGGIDGESFRGAASE
jgi:hypothetical protein